MKLQARQIDAFLKSPDKAARAVLIYGPDQGLVKERAKILGLKIVPDLNDAFNDGQSWRRLLRTAKPLC